MSAGVAGTILKPEIGDRPETSTALTAFLTPSEHPPRPIHHTKTSSIRFRPNRSYTNPRDVTSPTTGGRER